MDNKENKSAAHFDEKATVPLAYHEVCMTRNHRTVMRIVLAWAISVVIVVISFVALWLQYDYAAIDNTTGVYVISDADGNVIASDLEPDDVIRIMEELNNGQSNAD